MTERPEKMIKLLFKIIHAFNSEQKEQKEQNCSVSQIYIYLDKKTREKNQKYFFVMNLKNNSKKIKIVFCMKAAP